MKIEKTFIISLPFRLVDRLIPLIDYLKSIELDYFVWGAFKQCDGRVGLIKTIKSLFTDVLKTDKQVILVLEDDCFFLQNPIGIIDKCLQQLPEDFDLCYLGCNLWQENIHKHSDNLLQVTDVYGTQSIIYSRTGMQKIVDAIIEIETDIMQPIKPYDVIIKEKIMPDGKCFCSFPNLTSQIVSHSDIENKVTDWRRVLETRFTEKTAHLKNNLAE